MALEVVQPRIRGFLCLNAHPEGCRRNVLAQIEATRKQGVSSDGLRLLVIGASTGYGLAARIAGAFGYGAKTVGVFFERPPDERRTASAGYYNAVAFHQAAQAEDLYAASLNGDAFSGEIKAQTLERIRRDLGGVDGVVYSLASPRRVHPQTGVTHSSILKPIGETYTTKSIDLNTGEVVEVSLEAATETEIADTVAVMGGEDYSFWIQALSEAGLMAEGAWAVAFSYIGPEVTHAIYRRGTIGRAKEHLEATAQVLNRSLKNANGGGAYVSVNKAVVTQASSAIPAVPLYLSLLYPLMREQGTHEDPIHQMNRLLREHLGPGRTPSLDEEGRIRLDDLEMTPALQREVTRRWEAVETANLDELADFKGFQREFRQLFGFEVPGVEYDASTETALVLEEEPETFRS